MHQIDGERNFHIFYQLLRGASEELKSSLEIDKNIDDFSYLCGSQTTIPHVSDAEELQLTRECMRSVGIDDTVQGDIFRLLSGILHLGNINFVENGSEEVGVVAEATRRDFETVACMLGVTSEDLLTAMTKQNMHVGGSTIVKLMSFSQVKIFQCFCKCIILLFIRICFRVKCNFNVVYFVRIKSNISLQHRRMIRKTRLPRASTPCSSTGYSTKSISPSKLMKVL